MSSSKITSKYQATIPKAVRDVLHLKAGDTVVFQVIDKKIIVIKKAKPFDKEYLRAVQHTLTEWESENDEEAFRHLQDL